MKISKLVMDIVLIIIGLFICNSVFDLDLMYIGIPTWMILFGGIWIVSSILSIFLFPEECFFGIKWGLIICFLGAYISVTYFPKFNTGDPRRIEQDEKTLGTCPEAEWVIVLKYKNKDDITEEFHMKYTGSVNQVQIVVDGLPELWKEKYPEDTVQEVYKGLLFVPRPWLKEHKLPIDYSMRTSDN